MRTLLEIHTNKYQFWLIETNNILRVRTLDSLFVAKKKWSKYFFFGQKHFTRLLNQKFFFFLGNCIFPALIIEFILILLFIYKIEQYLSLCIENIQIEPLSNFMLNFNKINEIFLCILSISSHNTQNLSLYINIL